MKKLIFTLSLFAIAHLSFATEGMWIPSLLNAIEDDMHAYGLQISADEIYSINHSSLKDAIVHFGGGCTAEVISSQGLLLTNHHCGFSQIQQHSSVENDYLKNGFWAATKQDELANPGLTATFIVRMDDVTSRINVALSGLTGAARSAKLKEVEKDLVAEFTKNTKHEAYVRPFNFGNSYFIIVTKTYKDVRLVGAPPSAIGKFGGDTDNWMWPRHTGDFSMFRIYADANNEPAEFSKDNIPYAAPAHLKVSMDGVKEGDFTMVFGFPGRTEQFLTPKEVEYVVNEANPMRIHFRETSLGIIDQAMRSSDKTRIQYAAKQSSISNAYKKWIGQNAGLIELNAIKQKFELERSLEGLSSVRRKDEYYNAIMDMRKLDADIHDYKMARDVFIEYYYYGPEILAFANGFDDLINNFAKIQSEGKLDEKVAALKAATEAYFKDLDADTEKKLFTEMTPLFFKYMPEKFIDGEFKALNSKSKGNMSKLTAMVYGKSAFTSQAMLNTLLAKPSQKAFAKLAKDPAFKIASGLVNGYSEKVRPTYNELNGQIDQVMMVYVRGLMETFPNKTYWYDANSTLRLTYGKAEGSSPNDGMQYNFCTTAKGILQKHRTGNPDYDLPPNMAAFLEKGIYGPYADEDGELHVCFTGSNHTTGGNSGSPALNAKGELIGLNFDRSWESTMSDILFDADRCRNIMVDIRYVLWVVDVYCQAGHLVKEMTLVKGQGQEKPETEKLEIAH